MDGQELLEQEAAFEASFSGNEQPTTSAPASADPAVAAADVEQPAAATSSQESPATGEQQQEQAPAPAADDPVVFGGFKQSEVQRLLEQAAKVGELELQLRKAHGHIGDLKRHMAQQPSVQQVPPQTAPAPADPKLEQFKQDFPEIAEYIQAVIPQTPIPQQAPPAEQQQTVATEAAPAQAALTPEDIELALMDRMHTGWRETVQSQEFNLWLGAQPEPVQQEFGAADTADRLGAVLGQYQQWSAAKAEAATKAAKSQQRLKQAVTPTGQAQRPTAEPTEEEAFIAAFTKK